VAKANRFAFPMYGLKSVRENWVLYQGTTLVVPQLLENIAGL
jgi:hypothetical protein